MRNIRRDANSDIKDFLKEKEISEDDARRAEDQVQKVTDQKVKMVDALLDKKENELMEF